MPERRMSDVVRQRQRLRQILIEPESVRHGARDLRHLDGMRQTVAEVIGESRREHLRLVFQAPERAGMNDAVAIALKFIAIRMGELRITAASRALHRKPEMSQGMIEGVIEASPFH